MQLHTVYEKKRDYGGYSKLDVPRIAYDWRNIWGAHIKVNHDFVREVGKDVRVQRRAFSPEDLEFIEGCMRLTIVGCNRHDRITVQDGCLLPSAKRAPAQDRIPTILTVRRQGHSPQSNDGTPASRPTPKELTYSKSPPSNNSKQRSRPANITGLRLEDVSVVTKDGDVRHRQVSWLAVLELAYNSYDFENGKILTKYLLN